MLLNRRDGWRLMTEESRDHITPSLMRKPEGNLYASRLILPAVFVSIPGCF